MSGEEDDKPAWKTADWGAVDNPKDATAEAESRPFDASRLAAFASGEELLESLKLPLAAQLELAERGTQLLRNGQTEKATVIFQGLYAMNQEHPYFALALGSIAQKTGHYETALAWYDKAVELGSPYPSTYINRGEVKLTLNDREGAKNDLKKAVAMDPNGKSPATVRAREILKTLGRD